MFALTSRYYGIATAAFRLPDGRTVIYVRRRFLPQPEDLVQTGEHVVTAGERPDPSPRRNSVTPSRPGGSQTPTA